MARPTARIHRPHSTSRRHAAGAWRCRPPSVRSGVWMMRTRRRSDAGIGTGSHPHRGSTGTAAAVQAWPDRTDRCRRAVRPRRAGAMRCAEEQAPAAAVRRRGRAGSLHFSRPDPGIPALCNAEAGLPRVWLIMDTGHRRRACKLIDAGRRHRRWQPAPLTAPLTASLAAIDGPPAGKALPVREEDQQTGPEPPVC